jgi:serine/threonine protein kinase/Tol biopolymer transport system component
MIRQDRLTSLANDVADGRRPDWHGASAAASNDRERAIVAHLKALAELSRAYALASGTGNDDVRDSAPPPLPPFVWGPLHVQEQIGRGRFGRVYRAWDPSLERLVALKLLTVTSDDQARIVVEEGRLAARVRHPNVITVFGAQRIDGRTGIWMELVEGHSLDAETRQHGPLSVRDVALAGIDLSRAVGAVHAAGLIHRDIKSTNVMRDRTGRLILGDFGTGRGLDESDAARSGLAGTPAFLAPEIFEHLPATERSDIYSLGVLLFHAATGRYPVAGNSLAQIRDEHSRPVVPARSLRRDLPRKLAAVIDRARDRDPARRFASAAEMERAIASAIEKSAVRTRWAAAAAGLVAIAITFGFLSRHQQSASTSTPQVEPPLPVPTAVPAAGTAAAIEPATDTSRPSSTLPSPRAVDLSVHRINEELFSKANLRAPAWNGIQATCTPYGTGAVAICDLRDGTWRILRRPETSERLESAHPSPDGKLVSYLWIDRTGRSIRVMNLDGTGDRELFRGGDGLLTGRWTPDSRSLIVPVRQTAGAVTFTEVPLQGAIQEVAGAPAFGELSPDRRFVLLTGRSDTQRDLAIFDLRTGQTSVILPDLVDLEDGRWLPDGSGIVFVSARRGERAIFHARVANGRASSPRLLHSFGRSTVLLHDFSGDGRLFLRVNAIGAELFTAPIDVDAASIGSPTRISPASMDSFLVPDWSPDGQSVAYRQTPGGARTNRLVIRNLATQQERSLPIPSGGVAAPRWLRDGRRIAISHAEAETSVIEIMDIESGKATRVASSPSIRWIAPHPAADALYFSQFDAASFSVTRQAPRIYRVDLASGETSVAFEPTKHGRLVESATFDVSASGDLAVIAAGPGTNVIRLLRAAGTIQDIDGFPFGCGGVQWAPDGIRLIANCAEREGPNQPWILDSATRKRTRFAMDDSTLMSRFLVSRAARTIAFVAGSNSRPDVWTIGGIK